MPLPTSRLADTGCKCVQPRRGAGDVECSNENSQGEAQERKRGGDAPSDCCPDDGGMADCACHGRLQGAEDPEWCKERTGEEGKPGRFAQCGDAEWWPDQYWWSILRGGVAHSECVGRTLEVQQPRCCHEAAGIGKADVDGSSGASGGLDDSSGQRTGRFTKTKQRGGGEEDRLSGEEDRLSGEAGASGGLGDTELHGSSSLVKPGKQKKERRMREPQGPSSSGLGNSDSAGPQGRVIGGDSPSEWALGETGLGFWGICQYIPCADGKSRRFESPSFEVVDGLPKIVEPVRAESGRELEEEIQEEVNKHVSEKKRRAGEEVSLLWRTLAAEAIQGDAGGFSGVSSPPILLSFLLKLAHQGECFSEDVLRSSQETKEALLRSMWWKKAPSRTPCKRGLDGQLSPESSDLVCILSSILARYASESWGEVLRQNAADCFPLSQGVKGRVSLLRGYGNAICPPLAAQFILACASVVGEQPRVGYGVQSGRLTRELALSAVGAWGT